MPRRRGRGRWTGWQNHLWRSTRRTSIRGSWPTSGARRRRRPSSTLASSVLSPAATVSSGGSAPGSARSTRRQWCTRRARARGTTLPYRLRRRLPADEPSRGHSARGGADRHARQVPHPSSRRRRSCLSGLRAGGKRVMDGLQRGSAAIVGVAESDLGAVAGDMSPIDLMAQGIHRALADCGLALRDVDGLLCATAQTRTSGLAFAEYLGISPAFVDTTILGGSSFMFHVAHAQAALQLGLCKIAVIAYGSTQRTIGRRHASVREYNPYETPFRPFLPSTAYALAASRHMHQYGTTREQLAAVAVAAR